MSKLLLVLTGLLVIQVGYSSAPRQRRVTWSPRGVHCQDDLRWSFRESNAAKPCKLCWHLSNATISARRAIVPRRVVHGPEYGPHPSPVQSTSPARRRRITWSPLRVHCANDLRGSFVEGASGKTFQTLLAFVERNHPARRAIAPRRVVHGPESGPHPPCIPASLRAWGARVSLSTGNLVCKSVVHRARVALSPVPFLHALALRRRCCATGLELRRIHADPRRTN